MLDILTDAEKGRFLMALIDYEKNGVIPTNDGKVEMAFMLVKPKLDKDIESYNRRCEINAQNAKKGGRPKKEKIEQEYTADELFPDDLEEIE